MRGMDEAIAAMAEIRRLVIESRVAYFDELVGRGLAPRGAYLMICRLSGYL
jgi:hypothetical protein